MKTKIIKINGFYYNPVKQGWQIITKGSYTKYMCKKEIEKWIIRNK